MDAARKQCQANHPLAQRQRRLVGNPYSKPYCYRLYLAGAVVAWEHHVVLVAVPLHLVHSAAAAGTHETPHSALIDDLQGLGEVRVVQKMQNAQLLVRGAAGYCESTKYFGGNVVHPHRVHRLHRSGNRLYHCWDASNAPRPQTQGEAVASCHCPASSTVSPCPSTAWREGRSNLDDGLSLDQTGYFVGHRKQPPSLPGDGGHRSLPKTASQECPCMS